MRTSVTSEARNFHDKVSEAVVYPSETDCKDFSYSELTESWRSGAGLVAEQIRRDEMRKRLRKLHMIISHTFTGRTAQPELGGRLCCSSAICDRCLTEKEEALSIAREPMVADAGFVARLTIGVAVPLMMMAA
eukprot:jgi/Mesvir1/3478/Mv11969-RA.1